MGSLIWPFPAEASISKLNYNKQNGGVNMSDLDILKLMQLFGEETELADFTPDELQELLEKLQNDGEDLPLSKEAFKEKYFAYYDDIKDKSLKKQDW